ncbi:hypothetical protein GPJ59_36895, partial [Streptomyces bambusae]|nr:hypothetical protein [Streptomyces bambusae]
MVRAPLRLLRPLCLLRLLLSAVLLCAAVGAAGGCVAPPGAPSSGPEAPEALAAPDASVEQGVRQAVAAWAQTASGRPAGVPLEQWSYEVGAVRRDGDGRRAVAEAPAAAPPGAVSFTNLPATTTAGSSVF